MCNAHLFCSSETIPLSLAIISLKDGLSFGCRCQHFHMISLYMSLGVPSGDFNL